MNYYFADENQAMTGPHTAEEMGRLFQEGTLHDDSWVIQEGTHEWKPYRTFFSLALVPSGGSGGSARRIRVCGSCGTMNEPSARFCDGCGTALGDATATEDLGTVLQRGFTKHAFISHSSRDYELAVRICQALEEHGLSCWIAPRDIDPGRSYDEEILRGIAGSQTYLLLLSAASNESDHVKRELMVALRAGHAVYPIRIEEVQPGPKLEYLLEGIHWVDAWMPPIEVHLDRLAHLIASPDAKARSELAVRRKKQFLGPHYKQRLWGQRLFTTFLVAGMLTAGWWFTRSQTGEMTRAVGGYAQKVMDQLGEFVHSMQSSWADLTKQLAENSSRNAQASAAPPAVVYVPAPQPVPLPVQPPPKPIGPPPDATPKGNALNAREQTFTLSWASDPKADKEHPSRDQIFDKEGNVLGEASLDGVTSGQIHILFEDVYPYPTAELKLLGPGDQQQVICTFRFDDPVGQTRLGRAQGMPFSARVTDVMRQSFKCVHDSKAYPSIEKITIEVRVNP